MQSAILDACVLYPAPLRDFFMRLAVHLYQPKWTAEIHDEWMRNLLKDRPDLSSAQIQRTRELMDLYGGDCIVKGYKHLIPTLTLPDRDDRHVLAAGIIAKAHQIVTFNLSDFPNKILSMYGIAAIHPDEFACQLYSAEPVRFIALVRQHRIALVNPAKSPWDYLSTLHSCGLIKTALVLQSHIDSI